MDQNNHNVLNRVEYDLDADDQRFKINDNFVYRVDIDWSKVEIPELQGDRLWKNKTVMFDGSELKYGPNNFE